MTLLNDIINLFLIYKIIMQPVIKNILAAYNKFTSLF